ncbi:hypothetical protein C5167_043294 [Papaver somniferum]|uniref:Uncharacterized protein n=1 Tax=Papaver somniferum TaxID=3469 RepID=A0A4Y7L6A8_PAPSO|nr:hypothetical protein C5167_043294 [Papaver somniferum]
MSRWKSTCMSGDNYKTLTMAVIGTMRKERFPQGAETELKSNIRELVKQNQSKLCCATQVRSLDYLTLHKTDFATFPKYSSHAVHAKKRKTSDSKPCEVESEQEEHSLSLSQNSSPSQSDQEQTPIKATPRPLFLLKQRFQNPNVNNVVETQPDQISSTRSSPQDFHFVSGENPRHPQSRNSFYI